MEELRSRGLRGEGGDIIPNMWHRNHTVPETVEQCVHELMQKDYPDHSASQALHAWDGNMTYGELDNLSTRLARHLASLGVHPECVVPLCFEKSMWTVVAMLAVLKAGGAFAPLNPEHPESRHQEIIRQTRATVVLTSARYSTLWEYLDLTVVKVDKISTQQLADGTKFISATPSNAAYVMFTSGSTGVPKGVVLEHRAISTSCLSHGRAFGFTRNTRALQFASYTFDACITEIITTLIFGGCVCIPSEDERRNNLSKAISTMAVNWALLTPTVARLLEPSWIPSLKTLVLGGEQINMDDCERWDGHVQVINTYGPTECSVWCTFYMGVQNFKSGTIGKSIASVSWVVDQENHNKLVPVDSIGELLVEGPILARGYLNDYEKTKASFINDPGWLLKGGGGYPGRQGRLYKTGDLVYCKPDGNLIYVGRKDDQVKVRGQRIELGEIEHHLRSCLPKARQVAVVKILPMGEKDNAMLAAFMQLDDKLGHARIVDEKVKSDSVTQVIVPVEADEKLAEQLPRYMIPEVYFAIVQLPMTISGKTDRKRLQEIGASFTPQQLAQMRTSSQGPKRAPSTKAEQTLQNLWAQVLNIERGSIGLDDSFFRLGGDSVAAMKLVGEARRTGLQLTVEDIFRNPRLEDIAGLDYSYRNSVAEEIPAFSLLGDNTGVMQVREEVAVSCGVDASLIEDIYPCSPLQEGMISLTSKRSGDYIMQSVQELPSNIDENTLRAAWEHVVRSTAALRTRIVQNSKLGLLQAVMAESIQWVKLEGLDEYLKKDKSASMGLNDPLTRYALIDEPKQGKRWLVWTIHHALYDGWSLPRIVNAVKEAYDSGVVEKQHSFNAFIKYLGQQDLEAATIYWQNALADCEATPFPPLPATVLQPVADATVVYRCPPLPKVASNTTTSTLIRAAWAIVVSNFTNSSDVVFGATVTGRSAPVPGIESMIGPTIATVPVRVLVQGDDKVSVLLGRVQRQATDMIPYEQTGLQQIAKVSTSARHACSFQTMLIMQIADDEIPGAWRSRSELQDFTTYGLMVQCTLTTEGIRITASFDARVVDEWVIRKLLGQFNFVMELLACASPEAKVADIDTYTPEDRQELLEWNSKMPAAVERCIHDLFADQAKAQPNAPVICAWDGEMAYGELDALSTKLAGHLAGLGVKPGEIIPLCFEKSMWTVVAILAVLKAGGAFLLLDPSLPTERLKSMCRRVSGTLALTSEEGALAVNGFIESIVVVTRDFLSQGLENIPSSVSAQPMDTAYIIFTSGSTGEPKGCRIEHRSACSALVGHGRHVNMDESTRTLQFGSYSFAGSLAEILLTLVHGGCICIPSKEERTNGLASAISRMKANWAFLTSTVLDLLSPDLVPTFTTLCVGGEPIRSSQIMQWQSRVHLRQTYGSSETSGFVSSTRLTSSSTTADVGKASTGIYWIVDPNDYSKLSPLGAVGEVLIEGPILGQEYIGEPDKTASTFVEAPAWRDSFGNNTGRTQLYRTGDLARYKQDGSIELLGRKDSQVKLRGQRIELGEIEHQARLAEADVKEIAVELIRPQIDVGSMLACFVVLDNNTEYYGDQNSEDASQQANTQRAIRLIQDRLERFLPQYMVPTIFIPIAYLPITSSRKIDRKRLRGIGSSLSTQQLAELRILGQGPKRLPSTEAEQQMQQLWAKVLHVEPEGIGLDDSFFRLGGDSIVAMKLVGEARRTGLQLTVEDIFRNPRLAEIAGLEYSYRNSFPEEIPAFALLGDADVMQVREEVAVSCGVDASLIEDIYPCSPLQEGLMSLSLKRSGDYIMQSVLELRTDIDEDSFRAVWEHIVRATPVLRSRIVQNSNLGLLQAVMAEGIRWLDVDSLEEYLQKDKSISMGLSDPLTRYAFVKEAHTGKRWMAWTIHHALYDGWSLPYIMDAVKDSYNGSATEKHPGFNSFIKYLNEQDQEGAAIYWQAELDDCQATPFPPLPPTVQQPVADATFDYQCGWLPKASSDTTTSTLIRAAWAIVVSNFTNSDDVVFGTTVTGRNAPIPGIEAIIGPTIATVPVRVRVRGDETASAFLGRVQQQATDMIPYEHAGLQRIAKVSASAQYACSFQTMLIVQPVESASNSDETLGQWHGRSDLQDFITNGLMLQCTLAEKGIRITASFDKRIVGEWLVKNLFGQFNFVMQQLAVATSETTVADIGILAANKNEELRVWNSQIPVPVERCIHDLFAEQAKAQPNAPVICAWDGEMTYGEVDALSTKLAGHLVGLGVKPGEIVSLCFEKSMWTVVAILAVLKAGGAFLLLDPSLPTERLKSMCRRVSGTLALSSHVSAPAIAWLFRAVVVITRDLILQLPQRVTWSMLAEPTDSAYVIFTSGSTGEPKGCRIDHQAACSALVGHGRHVNMDANTRTLQFGSYSFAGSLAEILLTLVHGGCICIPSEEERTNRLASAISRMKANWAFLTSTALDLLTPESAPTLTTLCVGGEPIRSSQIAQWQSRVHLRQTYGSSETSGFVSSIRLTDASAATEVGKASTGVYWIVDPNDVNQLSPMGAVGEVLIEGPVLGQEYIGELDKTASTFVKAPAWRDSFGKDTSQSRLYRTGDLARYKQDGSIELLGRKDNQVKLRGQRIELGEIEQQARLAETDVKEIAVELIKPQKDGDSMLACFIVFDGNADNQMDQNGEDAVRQAFIQRAVRAIQDRLERLLPQYMVPTIFVPTEYLPTTPSRKIDRKRLREIGSSLSTQQLAELRILGQGLKRLPSTEVEQQMQQLWAKVLHVEPEGIGLDDSFFRLGGDSIAAMKLVGEARRAGMQLTVSDLFHHPRLEQFTYVAIASSHGPLSAIPHSLHLGLVEQSFAQGRLWFLEELYPSLNWYLIPFTVRIRGPLQLTALQSALLAIENRHETLRTTFATIEGASVQIVQPFQKRELSVTNVLTGDKNGHLEAIQQEQATPFDLRKEPGWKFSLYRVNESDHVLSIVMHHIISDGWSVDILMRELSIFYSAAIRGVDPLSQTQPLPIQYRDFSLWQRQQSQVDEHQRQLRYWVTQLQSSRPAELLCDKPRPATLSGIADTRSLHIESSLFAKLQRFCNAQGVTLFVALLAVFRVTHYRLTGQDDATIGTANANRDRWEVKDMIGFFVNMQCLRITVNDESFEELVEQVHAVVVASIANQDVPFESIVSKLKRDRDLSRHPLAQIAFVVHSHQGLGQLTLEGLETEVFDSSPTSRFDLEFHFFQEPNGLRGDVVFSNDLYAPETISNMLSLFHNVLEACLREPNMAVASLPLLTDAGYAELDQMGLTRVEKTAYPRESSIIDVFRKQVSTCPSQIAVKDSSTEMTYIELDRSSDTLARWLAKRSLAPETLVGVFANRSCQAVVVFLGILKANLAYLPFDVKIPERRMEAILSSVPGKRVIFIGDDVQSPDIELDSVEFVLIREALSEQANNQSIDHPLTTVMGPSATSLAYVMFTSGSTGKPKGVMVEHRGIVRLVKDNNLAQHLPGSRVTAHMANLAFDVSTWEIYTSLLNAGTLICINSMAVFDTEAMFQLFSQHDIRIALFTPALFRQHVVESPGLVATLELLCFGGEAMHSRDFLAVENLLKGPAINCYGPTENTGASTIFVLTKDEKFTNGVPIGHALSNSGAYVMDSKLQLVPLGVFGELVVTGDGLARGYTDSEQNTNHFVSATLAGKVVRAYRTGDYVRRRPIDGQLEFFGRMDGQIKIRGQRIELGEIEHVLRNHTSISDAIAVLQGYGNDNARLAGFVTMHEGGVKTGEQSDNSDEAQHVDTWEEQFDSETYSPIFNTQVESIGRDFIGWTSMYDGRDIDKVEMNEWLDDTIETILNNCRLDHVLEIGSGTGMILFNLGTGLQSYVGLDPSKAAVKFIEETAKSVPTLASKVRMYKATAADISWLDQPISTNLVIMNSVVQYFPSQEYLFKLVQDLLQLEGVETLFFGDIRSYALYQEFLAMRALHMVGDKASKADIRRMIGDMERVERELLVDPAFFTALPSRFPGLVTHVEIVPKKMKATNELSCYRYAAIIHVKAQGRQGQEVRQVGYNEWIDFSECKLDRQSLLQRLKQSSGQSIIAVSNIPYSKTVFSRCLVDSLDDTEAESVDDDSWLLTVNQKAQQFLSLSATDLVELAHESEFRVEISWNRQHSQRGGLDAVFYRPQPKDEENRILFQLPTDHAERSLHSLSSQPLRPQTLQKIQQQLYKTLQAQLPAYMVPQSITILEEMPINQNGKVDRKALAQWKHTDTANGELVLQPTTDVERTMQTLWAQVLDIKLENIGLNDSFFHLGGDSIAAMKLVGEARRTGMQLTVADLFRNPQLGQLASMVIASVDNSLTTIPHVHHPGPAEQSFAQGRLWFLEELHPGLTWYLMPFAARIKGQLNLEALHSALLAIENRHDTLRTTFATNGGSSVQIVQPFHAKELVIIDMLPGDEEKLMDAVERDHTTPFNLHTEPGWRVSVYRIDEKHHILSIVMHHIISDGWSIDILMRELSIFYSFAIQGMDPLSQIQPLPIQYCDFSLWQRQQSQIDEHQRQLDYWVTQLETSRPAELLCDKPRPTTLSGKADMQTLMINGPLFIKLQQLCSAQGVTLFVALLAVFRITHYRLTGQDDATIGTANANRDQWEVKDMIGFFVNMQCLRITINDESFKELVQQVHATTVAALANQDVPFESIVSKLKNDRDISRHPLVQLIFVVHSQQALGQLTLEGVETEVLSGQVTSRFDLEFHFYQDSNSLRGDVVFSNDLYAPETISNMLSLFHNVLEACLREPNMAVASLPLLTDAGYAELDQMGLTRVEKTAYPRESSIIDVFRKQVSTCPSQIAVKDSLTALTYAQLERSSDILARWLARRKLAPESLIGVLSRRSCQTIVAFLGILKANLAYLPFDIKIPGRRMEAILSSLPGKKVIFIGDNIQLPDIKLSNIEFVHIAEALNEQVDNESTCLEVTTPVSPLAASLAYVMFTSGSTGQPKGVMVEHRGIVRLVKENNLVRHLPASRVMAHMANNAFDGSTWEIYAALLNGGTLVCVDEVTVLDPEAVLRTFRQNGVQTAFLTTALFRTYALEAPAILDAVDMICVGGEPLHPRDFFAIKDRVACKIINGYGPTENTTFSTTFVLTKDEKFTNGVPIGRALSNSGAYVMDSKLQLVPLGAVGELVVTGDGLARGYTDPEQNTNRFVVVTIAGETVKAYRTGDYVRHRPIDGQLEFLGRIDGQIKIRGQRVELGEIEHVLRSHDYVNDAVAVLHRYEDNKVKLAGFVTVGESHAMVDEQHSDNDESRHEDIWEEQFDSKIYSSIYNLQLETIGRDFIGWTSMYDGRDIDKTEMNEWLDDTINTFDMILNNQGSGHILEIGSGTGMILFNLSDSIQSYVGIDPSRTAVEFIKETANSIPALASKVHMYKATAADIGRLKQPIPTHLAVINSVVQYFPSQEYLFKLLQDLLQLEGVQALFFGDIRSYALHQEFLATRALRMTGDKASKADIRRMIADMERVERELLVDPAFFTALPSRLPDLVEHVEILPKKMKATNELSCYRYAAVVYVKAQDRPGQEIRQVGYNEWIDFSECKLDRKSLLQRLNSPSSLSMIAISNIPYSKTAFSRCLLDALDDTEAVDNDRWLSTVNQKAQNLHSLSTTDLVEMAQEAGFRVEISWNRQYSQRGGLDAVFYRPQPKKGENRILFQFPTDHAERLLRSLSSQPLRQQTLQKIQQQLYKTLQAQLPAYMVPQSITVLEEMPINQNGKVDRKALAQLKQVEIASRDSVQQPTSEAEREMQHLWAQVLNIEPHSIGREDSFFRVGGDSIMAMKLVSKARRRGMQLAVADLFRNPKLMDIASIDGSHRESITESIPAFSLLGDETDIMQVREEVAVSCGVDAGLVDDVYPCSPLQEGMIALTSKRSGDYIMQSVRELRSDVEEDTIRAAWEQIFRLTAVLRTRIVQNSKLGLLQVVIMDNVQWIEAEGLEEYLQKDRSIPMELNDRLTRFAIVKDPHTGKRWMVWTIHHALYDGWSLPRIIDAVKDVSNGGVAEKQPGFNAFIKYLSQQDQEAAAMYWQTSLADCNATPFPPRLVAVQQPIAGAMIEYQCSVLPTIPSDITTSTLVRAAWAILVKNFTNSDDVVFGATVTGRSAPVAGIEAMIGPTIATVPVRVLVREADTIFAFLEGLQQQATDMIPYEQTGLQEIAKVSASARHACGFQMLLIVQPTGDEALGEWHGRSELQSFTTYGLMLQCTLAAEGIRITASFDERIIGKWQVKNLLGQFNFVIQQLACANHMAKVADIKTFSLEERKHLLEWNCESPATIDRCIQDLFAEQTETRPNAAAICAWDGEMTYSELHTLSNNLAGHLVRLGVKVGDIVPLCFEKSIWTVTAMLAVLKAGGAFLLLDPSLPTERLRSICVKTSSKMAVASPAGALAVKGLLRAVVVVTRYLMLQIAQQPSWSASVQPTDSAYIIFTSGSTGEPKGCRINHQAACSALVGHGRHVNMDANTRTLQFGSYSFAGSLAEILLTLVHGGCICIPSEEERTNRLASAISRMKANWAFLTSTALDLLTPESSPTLTTLCVGGEPIRSSQIMQWQSRVHLRQTYGSSETSGFVSSTRLTSSSTTADVGKASTGIYWIVDPNDYSKLSPLGAVGEVLIEGPILGQEYIGEPDKTASTFVEAPAWRDSFGNNTGRTQLYRTGDLARYKQDGSIELLGRKDSQVKLRGQRIELGEIEHQARLAEADVKEIAVELIGSQKDRDSMLVCFIVVKRDADDQMGEDIEVTMLDAHTHSTIQVIQSRLERYLPQYMVPGTFIPIAHLPKTSSRKIDRKRLREIGSSLSTQQLVEMRRSNQFPKQPPSSEAERTMQQLWARVLNIKPEDIGRDDSFFRLGGDSITAMKLVGEVSRKNIHLTIADIFRQPTLEQLAPVLRAPSSRNSASIPPFSLLPPGVKQANLLGNDSLHKGSQDNNVVDILPVTYAQRTFITQGIDIPRLAFNYFYIDLGPNLDVDLLKDSCRKLMNHFPILRTKFTMFQGQTWQIVLRDVELPFKAVKTNRQLHEESHAVCLQDIEKIDPLGPPTLFMLVRTKLQESRLIVRLSHAQYDGVCLPVILRTLASIYQQQPLWPATDFSTYLAHTQSQNATSRHYWRELLHGSQLTQIPTNFRPVVSEEAVPRTIKAERSINTPLLPNNLTMASLISSAWAVVLCSITGEEDVVYGHIVAGRNSDIPGIAEMVGPCLNIIPVRAFIRLPKTSEELIHSVQEQYISLGQSDATGWDEIVEQCTDWPSGSTLNSVIQHQNIEEAPEILFAGTAAKVQWFDNPFTVAPYLGVLSQPQGDMLKLTLACNTSILTEETACLLLDMLVESVETLSVNLQAQVALHNLALPA